jgi:hypothetical protein
MGGLVGWALPTMNQGEPLRMVGGAHPTIFSVYTVSSVVDILSLSNYFVPAAGCSTRAA